MGSHPENVSGTVKMDKEALLAFFAEVFPQVDQAVYEIISIEPDRAMLRLNAGERELRPGGTISGPSMMALADYALYAAILSRIGPVALAVTTQFSINFMRKPEPGPLDAECRLMKLGKRLAVGEVRMMSGPQAHLVAHAVGTYAIPDTR